MRHTEIVNTLESMIRMEDWLLGLQAELPSILSEISEIKNALSLEIGAQQPQGDWRGMIRRNRRVRHFTQHDLAERVEVHQTMISAIESGKNRRGWGALPPRLQAFAVDAYAI